MSLISKLEAAKGGSDDLDFEIAEYLDRKGTKYATTIEGHTPRWSQSLDAAVSLVPEGWLWAVDSYTTFATAGLIFVGEGLSGTETNAQARTPALALVIAALKARET